MAIWSFIKSKRAQSADDFETWVGGGEIIPTLNAFDVGDGREVVIIIDGRRIGDVRVTDEEVMQTVISRWGTGGGNVPAIAYSIREDAKADNFSANEIEVTNALQAHQPSINSHHAQTLIVEELEMEEPIILQEREGKAGGGKGFLMSDKSFSLRTSNFQTLFDKEGKAVEAKMIVRRLTPKECERLQGFPDDWTAGQADSARYKQMGNAVAVPVVNWIIERMVRDE